MFLNFNGPILQFYVCFLSIFRLGFFSIYAKEGLLLSYLLLLRHHQSSSLQASSLANAALSVESPVQQIQAAFPFGSEYLEVHKYKLGYI